MSGCPGKKRLTSPDLEAQSELDCLNIEEQDPLVHSHLRSRLLNQILLLILTIRGAGISQRIASLSQVNKRRQDWMPGGNRVRCKCTVYQLEGPVDASDDVPDTKFKSMEGTQVCRLH